MRLTMSTRKPRSRNLRLSSARRNPDSIESSRRKKDPKIIYALDKGLALLDIVAGATDSISLTEAWDQFGGDKATVFRLLSTLQRRGYVTQDPDTKKYSLGSKGLELSGVFYRGLHLPRLARPYLSELARATGETCHLGYLGRGVVVFIDRIASEQPLTVSSNVGGQEPLHCTALGKALLAHQSAEYVEHFLRTQPLTQYTPQTIVDKMRLVQEFENVRRDGVAFDDEEYQVGVRCIAAPVFNALGAVLGSIGISGPSSRLTKERVKQRARTVRHIAQSLSGSLGFKV